MANYYVSVGGGGGATITPWVEFTPTANEMGTISIAKGWWRQVGDTMEVQGYIKSGNPTGNPMGIIIPNGELIDIAKSDTVQATPRGQIRRLTSSSNIWQNVNFAGDLFDDGSDQTQLFVGLIATSSVYHKQNANLFISGNNYVPFDYKVPIVGWS
jgi:hypothetical protein